MKSPIESNTATPDTAPAEDTANIGHEMAKGTGWMIAARLSVQGIGLLSTIILARLLLPMDFGLVALATTFSIALQAISEFSFDVVLIQNQHATREHYDTAWTLSVCRNLLLAVCLVATAKWIAIFFGDPRLEGVIYWLALTEMVSGFENIGIIDFRKDLAFHRELYFLVWAKLGAFAITVPLAFMWHDYWALVAGIMAGIFLRVALSYLMCAYRPRFSFSRWRELMNFSKWLVLNNICAFLFNRSDTFIIGKMAGAPAVGIYTIALEIANLTTANLIAPLRRAILPGYAKLSEDREGLKKGFIDVLGLAFLIGAPLAVGIGAVANPLVRVMLGDQWVGGVPLIQVLSLCGFFGVVSAGSGPIFLVLGRPQLTLWILLVSTAVLIPSLVIGTAYAGALGAAWAVTLAAAVQAATDFVLIIRLLHMPIRHVVAASYRPMAACVVMVLVVIELEASWPLPVSPLGWSVLLAASSAVGAILYLGTVLILWIVAGLPDGAERHVARTTQSALSKVFKNRSPA